MVRKKARTHGLDTSKWKQISQQPLLQWYEKSNASNAIRS